MVTFATPTILAGDKSLVSLLVHSWRTRGRKPGHQRDVERLLAQRRVTTYVERRIMEAVYGKARRCVPRARLARLATEIDRLGGMQSKDTVLRSLQGRDPDDGATQVPHEKGRGAAGPHQQTVGREKFDAYLKGYFERHEFQSITTVQFLATSARTR